MKKALVMTIVLALCLLVMSTTVKAADATIIIPKSMTENYLKSFETNQGANTVMTRYSYVSGYKQPITRAPIPKKVFPKPNLHDIKLSYYEGLMR